MANWSPDRQQAVQARCDRATDGGEWIVVEDDEDVRVIVDDNGFGECVIAQFEQCVDDAEFCAHARQDLPDALAELAAKDAEIAKLNSQIVGFGVATDAALEVLNAQETELARQQADLRCSASGLSVKSCEGAKEAARE